MVEKQLVQCHYEVLGIETDENTAGIKKSHRKLALKYHPDKNLGDDDAATKFMLIQQAYEVLSDPQERKWYDDHRDAILAGWSASSASDNGAGDIMLFNVATYMHPGCYSSYHNEKGGFYQVYEYVFENIVSCELKQSERTIDLPTRFGASNTNWDTIRRFYLSWESFSSALNFAWEDKYNSREDGENRRIRRLMDEENKKARKTAKKIYNNDVLQLVLFVKRRDPRVKAKQVEQERLQKEKDAQRKSDTIERKKEKQIAKEAWREASIREMEKADEEDMTKGRIRLADLDDDYDYGGGKKKKGKKKNKKSAVEKDEEDETVQEDATTINHENEKSECISVRENENSDIVKVDLFDVQKFSTQDSTAETDVTYDEKDDISCESEEEEEENEPDVWICECCRKNFKSEAQMQNHMKSKKHKTAFKKYQIKLKKREEEIMAEMLEEMTVTD